LKINWRKKVHLIRFMQAGFIFCSDFGVANWVEQLKFRCQTKQKKRVSNADFALLCLLYQDILYLMHTMIFKLPAKSKCLKQFQKQNRGHLTLIQNNPLVTLHELSQLHCTESSQGSPDSRTFIKFTMLYKNVERSAIFLGESILFFFYDFKHFDFSGNLNIIACIRYMIAW